MKARVNVYQPAADSENQSRIPNALTNMRQYYLSHITSVMRLFGLAHITVKPLTAGLRSVPQINFRPMAEMPGSPQAEARNDIVRRLSEDMLLVGVLEVEITPTEDEIEVLKRSWEQLNTEQGAPELFTSLTGSSPAVSLNIEQDPTAKAVVESTSEEAKDGSADGNPTPESA